MPFPFSEDLRIIPLPRGNSAEDDFNRGYYAADPRVALSEFKKAARQGHQEARFIIAPQDDIPQDLEEAKKLLNNGFYRLHETLKNERNIQRAAIMLRRFYGHSPEVAQNISHIPLPP